MQLPTYSVNGKLTQLHRGLNIIQQFPDGSADLRTKNTIIKTKLLKNFLFLDISRNKKAEELKQQHFSWPIFRKTGLIEFSKTFEKFNASQKRNRYIKVFLLCLALGFLSVLFFTFLWTKKNSSLLNKELMWRNWLTLYSIEIDIVLSLN